MSENYPDKIRIKEARKLFGISESFLRHRLVDRTITPYKFGRMTFVSVSEIESLIAAGKMS